MAESKINGIIAQSLESIRSLVDANTIIGEPITAGTTTIIPVSKISMGIATGGLDYTGKADKAKDENNFGGGGGTGLSVTPVAFLIVHADGSVEMMNVAKPASKPADLGYNVSSLVDRAPEIIEKIKGIFKKKDAEPEKSAAPEKTAAPEKAEEPKDDAEEDGTEA